MTDIDRRGFVKSVAAVVPVAAVVRQAASTVRDVPAAPPPPPLDDELLHALGEAVLPTELDAASAGRVLADFQSWLEAYRPVAEINHGYGTGEIRYTPADPAPAWQAQLEALDLEAHQRFSNSFNDIDVASRRQMVRRQMARDRIDGFPRPHTARHVAVGLLAFYYSTPEAADLCYQRAIGKQSCRSLARSPDEPPRLDSSR